MVLILNLFLQDNVADSIVRYVLRDIFNPAREILYAVKHEIKEEKASLLESINTLKALLANFLEEHKIDKKFIQ